ncbi:conserved hypothetical protein [Methanococcus vannielii SB]|uniref:Lon proteolytic domain-containing protein n=1 Tax=Methanococcus vannielii (strain ATCC 35089 / DSM 1224 / JCM 13029 / OCM 148 / SB) TaxID=406327 RepID=A6UP70_METVS|nr:conserved hypothetical protein [Methanococcus vannielii SB]
MKKILAILIILISITSGFALNLENSGFKRSINITAPAVSLTDEGYVGAPVKIEVIVSFGNGHTFMDTMPLTELDMQGSARIASKVAFDFCGKEKNEYDVYYIIRSEVPTVGGPSAGAVLTVATIAAINGWEVNENVMMTGMIGPDGTIGPVGGILEKIKVGSEMGIDYFLIPYGQRNQVDSNNNSIDAVKYGKSLGITVIEVSNIYDAIYYFTGYKISKSHEVNPILEYRYIKTMEGLSEVTLERSKKELEELKTLDTSNLNSSEITEFEDALKSASNLIIISNEFHFKKEYYASTSRSFNALITLESIKAKHYYKDNESIKNYIDEVEKSVSLKKEKIKDVKLTKNNLEYVFAAKSRVYEAFELVEESKNSYENGDLDSAIYYASYAKLRAETGIWWLNLSQQPDYSEEIDEKYLKYLAREYLDNSEIVIIYSSMLFSEKLLSYPVRQIEESKKYYNQKEYLLSISKSIDAYVYATTILDYSSDVEYLKKLAVKKINNVADCGNNLDNTTYVPVSALGYLEYSNSLEDKYSKVLYLKYATAFAQMNIDILKELENFEKKDFNDLKLVPKNFDPYKAHKNIFTNIVYLLVGMLSGLIIRSIYSGHD